METGNTSELGYLSHSDLKPMELDRISQFLSELKSLDDWLYFILLQFLEVRQGSYFLDFLQDLLEAEHLEMEFSQGISSTIYY